MKDRSRTISAALGVTAIALVGLAGCASTPAATGEVASVSDGGSSEDTSTVRTTPVDPEQAYVDYTACMREHGIDLPDPESISGGGGAVIVSGSSDDHGDGVDPASDEFSAATTECQPLLDAAFGDFEIDPEREAEMRRQMLDHAQCMRDQGVDFPDPTFGDSGSGQIMTGIDATDVDRDKLEAAAKACSQILDGGGFTGTVTATPAKGQ